MPASPSAPATVGGSRAAVCAPPPSAVLSLLRRMCRRLRARWGGGACPRRPARRSDEPRGRPAIFLDKTLLRHLVELLRVCFPRLLCVESGIAVLLGALFLLRALLKLGFSRVLADGGKALLQRDLKRLTFTLADIVLYAISAAATDFGTTYTRSVMEQRFRMRVQNIFHREYFEGRKLYTLTMTESVDKPDHCMTSDVQSFCSELASLFSSVAKSFMDIAVLSFGFAQIAAYDVPLGLVSYYALVALLLHNLSPNFVNLMERSRESEGNLRAQHEQLVRHAEEVSFYRGEEMEAENADRLLRCYVRREHEIKRVKWWSAFLRTLLSQDGARCVGHVLCLLAVRREKDRLDATKLTQLSIRSTQLLLPLSKAVGELFSLHLAVSALCNRVHRVGELWDVLRAMDGDTQGAASHTVRVADSDQITFRDATFVSLSGQTVLRNFTATFKRGRHALITGCNGCGKTTLLRSLCGLWPLQDGALERPDLSHLFFLTQQVYLPPGSLRTQFIYPAVEEEERARGLSDARLLQLVADVGLDGVVEREGGLDAERAWRDVFSGGERQRVALVRALYHKPAFLFLDEGTSAVSQDVEPLLYGALQRHGVTLVTVSHREALRRFHQQVVNMDGAGGYTIQEEE